jgi:hypothetical protein
VDLRVRSSAVRAVRLLRVTTRRRRGSRLSAPGRPSHPPYGLASSARSKHTWTCSLSLRSIARPLRASNPRLATPATISEEALIAPKPRAGRRLINDKLTGRNATPVLLNVTPCDAARCCLTSRLGGDLRGLYGRLNLVSVSRSLAGRGAWLPLSLLRSNNRYPGAVDVPIFRPGGSQPSD